MGNGGGSDGTGDSGLGSGGGAGGTGDSGLGSAGETDRDSGLEGVEDMERREESITREVESDGVCEEVGGECSVTPLKDGESERIVELVGSEVVQRPSKCGTEETGSGKVRPSIPTWIRESDCLAFLLWEVVFSQRYPNIQLAQRRPVST